MKITVGNKLKNVRVLIGVLILFITTFGALRIELLSITIKISFALICVFYLSYLVEWKTRNQYKNSQFFGVKISPTAVRIVSLLSTISAIGILILVAIRMWSRLWKMYTMSSDFLQAKFPYLTRWAGTFFGQTLMNHDSPFHILGSKIGDMISFPK